MLLNLKVVGHILYTKLLFFVSLFKKSKYLLVFRGASIDMNNKDAKVVIIGAGAAGLAEGLPKKHSLFFVTYLVFLVDYGHAVK
jgi:hypothetical protein